MQELTEAAIYWSEDEAGKIDKAKFMAFLKGYKIGYGPLHTDWKVVLLSGLTGKLGWLEYSLKRSLGIECSDESEQQLGTDQTTETLNAINRYVSMIPELVELLKT